jgi:hypothetical protein
MNKMSGGSIGAPNLTRNPHVTWLIQEELSSTDQLGGFVGIVMRSGTGDTNARKIVND